MFDNPMETEWPRPAPRPKRSGAWRVLAVALAALGLLWCGTGPPAAAVTVVSSPSHMRQVEVLSAGGQTVFYLHNAGFHLRHNRLLIGVVYGGGDWRVTWLGPDSVKIGFARDWDRIVMGHAQGVAVAFAEPS